MTAGISLEEALEQLTVGEVRTIERHYGKPVEGGLSGTDLAVAVIFAWERRAALAENRELPGWESFDSWSMKQVNGYFAADEIEIDPSDPETEQGKGDSPDA